MTKTPQDTPGTKFEPSDLSTTPLPDSSLPPEIWRIIQSVPATFPPQYFLDVSRNLLENPNLTASHLSRAELSYTSFTDPSFDPSAKHPYDLASIIKHLKPDHQPRILPGGIPGFQLEWTVVRKLIPRNPKLDALMLQTCHLFTSTEKVILHSPNGEDTTVEAERYFVIYIPHATSPDTIPFYHPKVRGVAILYTFHPTAPANTAPGTLSIYFDLFPSHPLDNRMTRTALKMLEIIHKHSHGRMNGYQKRVHHDVVIPQKTFQDTYAYLKGKYAKQLMENWVEQTPAGKNVFEDLGIAAFLIELWTEMYGAGDESPSPNKTADTSHDSAISTDAARESNAQSRRARAQKAFPSFLDIGCGNGLLVHILNAEGWAGIGFDARRRKTWLTFTLEHQDNLSEMLLVPEVLTASSASSPLMSTPNGEEQDEPEHEEGNNIENNQAWSPPWHNGICAPGTFIISNHADELTPWTPILAYLSSSPFIAIPCCSYNFGGTRFRAPYYADYFPAPNPIGGGSDGGGKNGGKQVSAYTSLCSYIAHLTASMGYVVEKEHLRIPSTRNIAVIGRRRKDEDEDEIGLEEKLQVVRRIVEKEMGGETTIEQVRLQWLKRAGGLTKPGKGGGH
ncbi:DUF1613-domain-containing protein [Lentithecium fluviatile CBS 122367]|uniref:tRNA (uracil-O(2)-)-methyltransferase n=1 Tax=Lentithecium fluviatile CBS 122367 TaxID=1168545 RepID=A0A6G1JF91_9PLEO|nr:DUF1613-domain-containing protein [Lentithecium fluviatile CBS 122367]